MTAVKKPQLFPFSATAALPFWTATHCLSSAMLQVAHKQTTRCCWHHLLPGNPPVSIITTEKLVLGFTPFPSFLEVWLLLLSSVALPAAVGRSFDPFVGKKQLHSTNDFHHTHRDHLVSTAAAHLHRWVWNEPQAQKNTLSSVVTANVNLVKASPTLKKKQYFASHWNIHSFEKSTADVKHTATSACSLGRN